MSSSPSVTSRLQGGPERRRHVRCRVLERQLVTVGLGPDRRGLLVDISESGAAVQPYTELQTGDNSAVFFQLPGTNTTVQAQGVVSWVGPTGRAGIRFTTLPQESHEHLRRWIDGLAPAASPATTLGAALATAAYLPPAYSPWVRMSDLNVEPSRMDEAVADLDLVSALRLVVERSRALTRASGAAIALADKDEMVCRARTGVAPDLGARFRPDSGLSGEAVRTAKTVRCTDTADDPRVDRVACERLNVRSIVITPVLSGSAVIGVIEVFSPKAHAFDERDELHLRRMADLIAAMLESSIGHLEMGFLPDLEPEPEPAAVETPQLSAEAAIQADPEPLLQSAEPEPAAAAPESTETIAAPPAEAATADSAALAAGRYPLLPIEAIAEEAPGPQPAKEIAKVDVAEAAASSEPVPAPPSPEQVETIYKGFMQQVGEEDRRRRRKTIGIVLASVALAAIVLTAPYWLGRKNTPAVPPSPQQSAPPVPEPAVELPPPTSEVKQAAPAAKTSTKPAATRTKTRGERWSFMAPTKPGTGSELKLESPQPAPPPVADPAPAPEMERTPGQVKVINDLVGSWAAEESAGSQSQIVEGRLVNRVDPIFPPQANHAAARGRVVVRIGIDKTGRVERTEPVSGDPTLTAAAVQAIRQWRYEPYQLDGEPIAVEKTITIDFSPQR